MEKEAQLSISGGRMKRSRSSNSCSSPGSKKLKQRQHKKEKKIKKKKINKKSKRSSTSSESSSTESSSSDSDSSSSTDDSHSRLKRKKKLKKLKKKLKEKKKQRKKAMKLAAANLQNAPSANFTEDKADFIGPDISLVQSKARAPMTKEEWDKLQTRIERVIDPETGRHRLIRGEGEVIEEIVSRDRHQEINRKATQSDGNYFALQAMAKAKAQGKL